MKALVLKGFTSYKLSAYAGQTVELDEETFKDLSTAGYIKPVAEKKAPVKKAPKKKSKE